jgi:hypothetical protein
MPAASLLAKMRDQTDAKPRHTGRRTSLCTNVILLYNDVLPAHFPSPVSTLTIISSGFVRIYPFDSFHMLSDRSQNATLNVWRTKLL